MFKKTVGILYIKLLQILPLRYKNNVYKIKCCNGLKLKEDKKHWHELRDGLSFYFKYLLIYTKDFVLQLKLLNITANPIHKTGACSESHYSTALLIGLITKTKQNDN